MSYKWLEQALELYDEKTTNELIAMQQRYEERTSGNNCKDCGSRNGGTLIHNDGKPLIVHYGSFTSSGTCTTCRKGAKQ